MLGRTVAFVPEILFGYATLASERTLRYKPRLSHWAVSSILKRTRQFWNEEGPI